MRRVAWMFGLVAAAGTALAQAAPDDVAQRLKRAPMRSELYSVRIPNAPLKAGAARAYVAAPAKMAHRVLEDFPTYGALLTNLEKATVLGRSGDKTDVYVRAPVARGAKSLWAVLRFEPLRKVNDQDYRMTAKLVRGNMERFDVHCRVVDVGGDRAIIELTMLVDVDMPLPGALVTEEASRAAAKVVRRFRDRAELLYSKQQG